MIPCPTRAILIEKLNNIFEKNPNIKIIQMYGKILIGVSVDEHFPISPEMVHLFKYAPLISVDVKRSFSSLKNVLSHRRHTFKETNLEKCIIVKFNLNVKNLNEEFVNISNFLYIVYIYYLSV